MEAFGPNRRARVLLSAAFLLSVLGQSQTAALHLSDERFQQLILELSEPPGYFDTDNLISNESSYLHVVPELAKVAQTGQVYLGVGPDQNFTYIVHVQPSLAIILDLRHENLLQHLYLKKLIELSRNRCDYLSKLFGKPLPSDSQSNCPIDAAGLVLYFSKLASDSAFFENTFSRIWQSILTRFPNLVRTEDRLICSNFAFAFFEDNFSLKFRSHFRRPRPYYPSYGALMVETDRTGKMGHYLNDESAFQLLRRMQLENRILPVVGDFAGSKALKKMGEYLKKQNYVVSAFYLSNVEFYLFRNRRFTQFTENVARLPIDNSSVFIRSYFNHGRDHPQTVPGYPVTSLLQGIGSFLREHQTQPYLSYFDLVTRDYLTTPKVAE